MDEKWTLGTRVTKIKGSNWTGKVVGFYSTDLTPEGYAVESETERGSVQIYPRAALRSLEHTATHREASEAPLKERIAERDALLREAAWALIHACEQMAEDTAPMFAEMQLARGRGPYTGKQIGEELGALKAALQSRPADNTGLVDDGLLWDICRDVAELPDRDSPEDWPEAMLVTADELHCILVNRLTALRSNHDEVVEFAKAVLHGDEEHQAWLTEAAECWVAGKPLPKPRNIKESSNV